MFARNDRKCEICVHMKVDILGIKIDKIGIAEAVQSVEQWVGDKDKHYIVTPNIEFVAVAQNDPSFKEILNRADLAIPDSSRFGWAQDLIQEKNSFKKILKWPFFIFPKAPLLMAFETVTGTDLMYKLISEAADKGFTVGFLGGKNQVADRLAKALIEKYPKLKITYVNGEVRVDNNGDVIVDPRDDGLEIPKTDVLFVAFGQVKQEKWIAKNLKKYPVKVMMGVGGAFDYLSGEVPRAPQIVRNLGFEWLFRLMIQPWRIRRFGSLLQFIWQILAARSL